MAAAGGKKKMLATLVGCNYAGKEGIEDQSSINNVDAMHAVLVERFGFARDDITMLKEDDPDNLPTRDAIKGALDDMVKRAAPGDVLFFYFGGQGIHSASADGPGGRADNLIVPGDFDFPMVEEKFITDLYFRELVNRVPAGATFTMVCDSPQSGGLIDQEKEQIGPAAAANATRTDGDGVNADAGILLSGCQKDEQVADIAPEDCGGKRYGLFTWALQAVLKAERAPMSNREVVRRVREVVSKELIKRGLELRQNPCLYCSDANADAPFLGQQDTKAAKSN